MTGVLERYVIVISSVAVTRALEGIRSPTGDLRQEQRLPIVLGMATSESYSCSVCFLLSQVTGDSPTRPPLQHLPPSTPEPAAHLAAAAIILATSGPFQSVRALHRKLQRRVRSSSQLMYIIEGLVRDGLASLVQVAVRPARRSKAVFYKALPPPVEDGDLSEAFVQRLASYGITSDTYTHLLRRRDPHMDSFTHGALLREHPDRQRLLEFYPECTQNESESEPIEDAEHHPQLSESAITIDAENERKTVSQLELFHRFDKEDHPDTETYPDCLSQRRSRPDVEVQSRTDMFTELHYLERLCASGAEARIETENCPGNSAPCTRPGHTESGTPATLELTDNNSLSIPDPS